MKTKTILDIDTLKAKLEQFSHKRKKWYIIYRDLSCSKLGDRINFPRTVDDISEHFAKMSLTHNIVDVTSGVDWLRVSFQLSDDHTTNIDPEVIDWFIVISGFES